MGLQTQNISDEVELSEILKGFQLALTDANSNCQKPTKKKTK